MALTDEAIQKIKDMIQSGELKPGDKIPREPDLAEQLGLSRNSLREAVKALALINVLDVRRGDGTYVTSLTPDLLLDAVAFVVDFHQDASIPDFLAVRRILEPAAAAIAATRIDNDALAELRADLEALPDDIDAEAMLEHELKFHTAVASASGNEVLSLLVESISAPAQKARIWREQSDPATRAAAIREHRTIVEALESRDGDQARAAMLIHVGSVEAWASSVSAGGAV
jgi:GntR family transcriptional repressor for pyruvate dehydrogenase complex